MPDDPKRMRVRYSGGLSEEFWRRVNALPESKRDVLYHSGALLQELEERVLGWLYAAERESSMTDTTPEATPDDPESWEGPHLHRCPDCAFTHWDRQPKDGEVHAGDCICGECGYGL